MKTFSLWATGIGFVLTGCMPMNYTQSGAMVGSGLGAVTGAVIGGEGGHAVGGALAGAAVGAIAGGLVGSSEDARVDRDAAIYQASYEAHVRSALTNFDVMRMAQSGVSDDVLIGTIRSRGGRFDLGPDAIIQLKANGVGDRVILAMQQPGGAPSVVVVEPEPPMGVIVAPPPPPPPPGMYFEFGSPRPWRHRHHHHW